MAATILEICQDAAVGPALNLRRPESLFVEEDEGDTSRSKLVRALTKTVRYLASEDDWQELKVRHTFVAASTETQPGALPSDFLRFIPKTFFDLTRRQKLRDPLTEIEWEARKSQLATAVTPEIIIAGGIWRFAPTIPTGDTISFWYITKAVGRAAPILPATVGALITRYAANTDTTFFDEELLILGVEMNYRMGEGQDYRQQQMDFERMRSSRLKQDGGRKVTDMCGGSAFEDGNDRLDHLKNNAIVIEFTG